MEAGVCGLEPKRWRGALAAGYLYRERFVACKYGSEVIEITVPPMGMDGLNFGSEFDGYDLG